MSTLRLTLRNTSHTLTPPPPSLVLHTLCGHYFVKFFKPLPFPLKIVLGADFVSVFPLNILLHFETDNTKPKRLLFEKIENI